MPTTPNSSPAHTPKPKKTWQKDNATDLVQAVHQTTQPLSHSETDNMLNSDSSTPLHSTETNPPLQQIDDKNSFFERLKDSVIQVLSIAADQATELIEENRDISLSQESVNGLVERYVVKPVKYFDRLTTELTDHHFFLSGDMTVKGINITVSGEFEVITFEFNDKVQHMVFRQIGQTNIDKLAFTNFKTKLLTNVGLFYIRRILRKDPLAFALEYFDVATVNGTEYDFEIGRYFKKSTSDAGEHPPQESSIIKQLKRFQVKHAFIRDHKLYVTSGVKLSGFTEGLFDNKPIITEADKPEESSSILIFGNASNQSNTRSTDTQTHTETAAVTNTSTKQQV